MSLDDSSANPDLHRKECFLTVGNSTSKRKHEQKQKQNKMKIQQQRNMKRNRKKKKKTRFFQRECKSTCSYLQCLLVLLLVEKMYRRKCVNCFVLINAQNFLNLLLVCLDLFLESAGSRVCFRCFVFVCSLTPKFR